MPRLVGWRPLIYAVCLGFYLSNTNPLWFSSWHVYKVPLIPRAGHRVCCGAILPLPAIVGDVSHLFLVVPWSIPSRIHRSSLASVVSTLAITLHHFEAAGHCFPRKASCIVPLPELVLHFGCTAL